MKEYHKSLCLVFESEAFYEDCVRDRDKFKDFLFREYEKYPELFPKDFKEGWKLNGFTEFSKKNGNNNEKDRG